MSNPSAAACPPYVTGTSILTRELCAGAGV
jgi:hypothetical protein